MIPYYLGINNSILSKCLDLAKKLGEPEFQVEEQDFLVLELSTKRFWFRKLQAAADERTIFFLHFLLVSFTFSALPLCFGVLLAIPTKKRGINEKTTSESFFS